MLGWGVKKVYFRSGLGCECGVMVEGVKKCILGVDGGCCMAVC